MEHHLRPARRQPPPLGTLSVRTIYVKYTQTTTKNKTKTSNLIGFFIFGSSFFFDLGGTPRARWLASFNAIRSSI